MVACLVDFGAGGGEASLGGRNRTILCVVVDWHHAEGRTSDRLKFSFVFVIFFACCVCLGDGMALMGGTTEYCHLK